MPKGIYKRKLFSETHKQHISENHARYWLGKKRSNKTKKKIGKTSKGRKATLGMHWKVKDTSNIKGGIFGRHWKIQNTSKMGMKKEKHWSWIEDRTLLEYSDDWTKLLRKNIRQRDHHICQLCNARWNTRIKKFPVHHIDYDKKNCNPTNLITLCVKCHSKTNSNKKYWTRYFQQNYEISKYKTIKKRQ